MPEIAIYASNMAPFGLKLCQNAFQKIPNDCFFRPWRGGLRAVRPPDASASPLAGGGWAQRAAAGGGF